MVGEIEKQLGSDILQAVRDLGGKIDTIEEITRLRAPGKRRACFRLELTDGRTVKARRFVSTEKRASVTSLYPALKGLPFSRLLAVQGAATIEEWVFGCPVEPEKLSTELTCHLARILGTVHSRNDPRVTFPAETPTMDWYSGRLRSQLTLLIDQGHIDSRTAKRLFDRATNVETRGLEKGIIHTDFHPRNMVINPEGEVWIVDNEDIRRGPFDYDIARCWRQWPMTRAQRDAFCVAYADFRSLDSFLACQDFWSVCTLVNTTKIQMRHDQPIQSLVRLLERMSRSAEESLWPEVS